MKQLLHAAGTTTTAGGGGDDAVLLAFALGHRVFIYHHHTSGAAAVAAANDDDSGGGGDCLTELDMTIPATATTSATTSATTARKTAVAGDSGNDNDKKKKKKNVPPGLDGPNESTIQAIAVRVADDDDSCVVVCVALQNKQLLMFRRQAAGRSSTTTSSYPIFAHTVTDKRVTKLVFAPLDNNDNDDTNMVLVATDMLGDATAYEIPLALSDSSSSHITTITTKVKRKLLLGHTASVLTDLCLVPSSTSSKSSQNNLRNNNNNNNYFLLTADRDEKIRVSHFPRCYDIYGYLLAHTAFVTSVTALATTTTTTTPLVASTGGDGQLIVWNVATCEKIAACAIIGAGDAKDATNDATSNNTNNTTSNHNVIPTKVLALFSNNNNATTTKTTTLLVIADRDPHLYGFTYYYCDNDGDERQRMVVQPMKEPFTFPAVPIDFIVGWYNHDNHIGIKDTTTTTTKTATPTAALAVLFQDAPYIRCYYCTTTTTMDNDGVTTTTTLQLTETTPNDLTKALSMAILSSSSSSNDMIHVPDSLLEKRGGQDGIVLLAKHAREDAEKSFAPNDPERLPGSKEKIVLRHAKRQQQKKKQKTKTTTPSTT